MSAFSSLGRETFQQLLANAYAVQESQVDRKFLSAVMEVERLVTKGELDLDGAMHHIVECARNVANATGVAIALLKGNQLIYRAGSGSTACDIGRQLTASLTVSAHANGSGETLRVEDAQADKRIEADICRQFRARSLLILPIYQTRTLAGVLEVLFSEAHAFQAAEVRTYQLMARQIEAAIFQAALPEEKTTPIAQRPITLSTVPHVTDQAETSLNDAGSFPGLATKRSVSQRCGTTWLPARDWPIRNRPSSLATKIMHYSKDVNWAVLSGSLALAAFSTALVLTYWIASSVRRPVSLSGSSALPTSKAVDSRAHSRGAAEARRAKPTPAVQPPSASVRAAGPARPRVRHVRVGRNKIDYIGEDVTVRHFAPPPLLQRRPTADGRVAYIGNDVTVRYFTPKPVLKPDGW